MPTKSLPAVFKSKLFLALFLIVATLQLNAQTIPANFYGQNLWMPYTIGNKSTPLYGKLETKYTELNQSDAMTFRFGGSDVEQYVNYDHRQTDYVKKIDEVVAFRPNAKFVLQLPFNINNLAPLDPNGIPYTTNLEGAALQAKDIVAYVMAHVATLNPKPEIMWMICNEPDHPDGLNLTGYLGAQLIKNYVKRFSERIREADAASAIIAPGLTSFRNYDQMIDYLTNKNDATTYILPYITHFSFHYYPFNHEAKYDVNLPAPTRSNVIKILRTPVVKPSGTSTTPLATNLDYLKNRISTSSNPNVKIIITEANICYGNESNPYDPLYTYTLNNSFNPGDRTDDLLTGNGANSFIAGQFWAELMSIGMEKGIDFIDFWSTIEGTNAYDSDPSISLNKGNIGFIDNVSGNKKSTYHHFQMLARDFKGVYCNGFTPNINVKTFGSKDACGISVLVMNQNNDGVNGRLVTIKLRNLNYSDAKPAGTNIDVYINAGVSKTYTDYINSQETLLILYDGCGNPKTTIRYGINNAAPVITLLNLPAPPFCSYIYTCKDKLRCAITIGGAGNYTNETLTASKTITDSARISGTLTVPNNVVLTFQNAEAVFSPGAKIDVLPGGKLIINDSYLHGCEGQSWDGIKVTGSNVMEAQLIIARSKITDAVTAVKADKTNGISITESQFTGGTAAIEMYRVKGFTVSNNEITQYTYGIKSSNALASPSLIKANYFSDVKYAAYFDADNHSQLDIKCNTFDHYSDYAIYSNNSTLKDQGSAAQGAGNTFVSSSTQLNDKLHHNGSAMKYYYDPSNPLSLITGAGLTAAAQRAALDGPCTSTLREAEENSSSLEQVIAASINNADLLNCFPNPASDQATIVYSLPDKTASGEIRITNLLGELAGKYKTIPGENSIEVNCSDFKNGIYFYSLIIDQAVISTKKMVITK